MHNVKAGMNESGSKRTRKKEMAASGCHVRSLGKSRAQARTYTTVSTTRVGQGGGAGGSS